MSTTLKEGLVVGMRSLPGNPYDGHTLDEAIEQVGIVANQRPRTGMLDKATGALKSTVCRSSYLARSEG